MEIPVIDGVYNNFSIKKNNINTNNKHLLIPYRSQLDFIDLNTNFYGIQCNGIYIEYYKILKDIQNNLIDFDDNTQEEREFFEFISEIKNLNIQTRFNNDNIENKEDNINGFCKDHNIIFMFYKKSDVTTTSQYNNLYNNECNLLKEKKYKLGYYIWDEEWKNFKSMIRIHFNKVYIQYISSVINEYYNELNFNNIDLNKFSKYIEKHHSVDKGKLNLDFLKTYLNSFCKCKET